MKSLTKHLPQLTLALLAAFLAALAARSLGETTALLMASSVLMFACCWASASHLLGAGAATRFAAIGVGLGWVAEQLGATQGWFFGSYPYTDVLGPRIGAVPCIIPLMWFALCYVAYVIANLIVWQAPSDGAPALRQSVVMSFLAAMIVTAYDLGADPYMVFTLKAWIMTKTDQDRWRLVRRNAAGLRRLDERFLRHHLHFPRQLAPPPATGGRRRGAAARAGTAVYLRRQHGLPGGAGQPD
jgi:hypothetical protein